jgi:Tfp pilus assembly protein PilV
MKLVSVRAFALLDVVLAVAIFAISVTGLIGILQRMNETSSAFARDSLIQNRLVSLLTETRRLEPSAMTREVYDPNLDMTFRTYSQPFQIENGEGAELSDLYELSAEVEFLDEGGSQIERVSLIVYRPAQ